MSNQPSVQPYPMNRVQRRAHYREAKRDPIAIYCPRCTHKTRHVAVPVSMHEKKDDEGKKLCSVVCVACGNVLRTGFHLVPYDYVGPSVVNGV